MTILFKKLGNYGRTGNMHFQCAATIGVAKKYGDNWRIPCLTTMQDFNIPDWNNENPISDYKVNVQRQGAMDRFIRTKPRYQRLTSL